MMKSYKIFLKKIYKFLRLDLIIRRDNRLVSAIINDKILIEKVNRYGRIKKIIQGDGNKLTIGENCTFQGATLRIIGNNNHIKFGKNCRIGPQSSFWMEGNNITITIGDDCTFNNTVHLCAQEDGSSISIGKDCMFANSIIVRTSDSHPIYSLKDNKRINNPSNVSIMDHVWVAPGSKIFKGVTIGEGSIVGSSSVVTKSMPENSLIVGTPAKVVKTDIYWTREHLF